MRDRIIAQSRSNLTALAGLLLIFVFIVAMRTNNTVKTYSLLTLGDSYTIGEKVLPAQNFPNQTVAILREYNFEFRKPRIVAKTGWTTDELTDAIDKTKLRKKYDFVTLLIGVNNQYRGRRPESYLPELESLVKKALDFAGGNPDRVIMLSIPDWSVTPFAEGRDRAKIANEIAAYNAAGKTMADRFHIHYVNITPGTQQAADDPELLAEDGLHPSGKAYAAWSNEVAGIIKKQLQ